MSTFLFLNPLYLIGLLSALIPLIIHLSRSRRTRKMRFSTTRFFTDQFLRSYRMSRVKELLLLLCRMALFGLLAMALARPFLQPPGSAAGPGGSGPKTVVLVLDDSASMGYVEDGKTLFSRAQAAADTILRGLSPGDTAGVVLASRRATGVEPLFPEPIQDLDEVRQAIERATVQALGTDLSGAITRAEELAVAGRAGGRSVTIYVLSDLQESGWDVPPRATLRSESSDTSFVFVSLRPRSAPANRAVTAVRYAATRPRVGVPFALRPLLALGREDDQEVAVRLLIDGARVGEQKVERLPGGRWAAPRFYHAFSADGWHGGQIELDDERLPIDNKRFFALEVPAQAQTVPLLVVNGAPSSVPHQDELYFLRLALTAVPEGQRAPFDLRTIAPSEVTASDLKSFPLAILANVEKLSEAAVEQLEGYVDGGGKLLVFLGDRVDPAFYNRALAGSNRRHGGLLPGSIKGLRPRKAGHISSLQYEHRALAAFQEPKLGGLLGSSLQFQALEVDAPATRVLMKLSDGLPLLCEKSFGKGEVLLFTSTCDRDWSDFPIRPGFLLWARFIADYLTQAPLNLQAGHRTGDLVRLVPPADEKGLLWVRKPDGTRVAAVRASDGSGDFEFTETGLPGVYTVLGSDQEKRLSLFACNLDTYESDLAYLDEPVAGEDSAAQESAVVADLKARLGQPPLVRYIADPASLATGMGGSGGGWKLWDLVLLVVLCVALFEPWLANQISARLYARTAAVPTVPGPQLARQLELETPREIVR
ncbi:MAG: BatA domain-containing protein [Gemmataceae bacterium]